MMRKRRSRIFLSDKSKLLRGELPPNEKIVILNEIHKFARWRNLVKSLGLGFILLVLIGCASLHQNDPIDIYRKTQSYKKFSFNDVWSAALRSIDEIDFIVRNATKEIGYIQALAKISPDPRYLPPRMNVIIREENSRIDVNFHIELPGQRDDTGKRRSYANQFFKALKKNLK